jgi:hypothetical protein
MIIVESWILEPKDTRTKHLDLSEPCIERGGNSTVHRGVLAQYLNTNFPKKIDLCHACYNEKCSNPKHLYWGTRKENIADAIQAGTWKNPFQNSVSKYGLEIAKQKNRHFGNKHGSGNKGKPKSESHKKSIANSLKSKYNDSVDK